MFTKKNLLILVGCIVLIIIAHIGACNKSTEKDSLINALQDTLKSERNNKGELKSTISTLKTEKVSTFLAIKSKDSTIIELQKEVARNKKLLSAGSSVSIIHSETGINTVDTGVIIIPRDTISKDSIIKILPEYRYNLHQYGDWITGTVIVNKDSVHLNIRTKHDYTVTIGEVKRGLFRKPAPYSEIISKSPYDSTTVFRTYQVTLPKKNVGLKMGITAALTFIAIAILLK